LGIEFVGLVRLAHPPLSFASIDKMQLMAGSFNFVDKAFIGLLLVSDSCARCILGVLDTVGAAF
jgi:hypothetical protein